MSAKFFDFLREVFYTLSLPFLVIPMTFSKLAVLTPDPINLNGQLELMPNPPLVALDNRAEIRIRWKGPSRSENIRDFLEATGLSKTIDRPEDSDDRFEDVGERTALAQARIGETIKVKLIGRGKTVTLSARSSPIILGIDRFYVTFRNSNPNDGIPPFVRFNKVAMESHASLKGIEIIWINTGGL